MYLLKKQELEANLTEALNTVAVLKKAKALEEAALLKKVKE
jgi:hypothetical protein